MKRTASGDDVAESRLGHLRHNYKFLPWLSSILFLQGQYDPFRRLETRLLAGAGARFDVVRGKHWSGAVGATYMYETEKLTDQGAEFENDNRFSFFTTMYSDEEETVRVDISAFYQPVVDDFADARAFVAGTVRVDVTSGVYLLVVYNLQHDSRPPAGVKQTDQSVRSGLGFEF